MKASRSHAYWSVPVFLWLFMITPQHSTSAQNLTTAPPTTPVCQAGQKKDVSKCGVYLKCFHNQWVYEMCPDAYMTYDDADGKCSYDYGTKTTCKECSDTDTNLYTERCDTYLACKRQVYVTFSCFSNEIFNPVTGQCEPKLLQSKGRNCTASPAKGVVESLPYCRMYRVYDGTRWLYDLCKHFNFQYKSETGTCGRTYYPCRNGCPYKGKLPAVNANEYIECLNENYVLKTCPMGQGFHDQSQQCSPRQPACTLCNMRKTHLPGVYQVCEFNSWRYLACPPGKDFDEKAKKCSKQRSKAKACRWDTPLTSPFYNIYLTCTPDGMGYTFQRCRDNEFYDLEKSSCYLETKKVPLKQSNPKCVGYANGAVVHI